MACDVSQASKERESESGQRGRAGGLAGASAAERGAGMPYPGAHASAKGRPALERTREARPAPPPRTGSATPAGGRGVRGPCIIAGAAIRGASAYARAPPRLQVHACCPRALVECTPHTKRQSCPVWYDRVEPPTLHRCTLVQRWCTCTQYSAAQRPPRPAAECPKPGRGGGSGRHTSTIAVRRGKFCGSDRQLLQQVLVKAGRSTALMVRSGMNRWVQKSARGCEIGRAHV